MRRTEVFRLIEAERSRQIEQWSADFDDKNTTNDWIAYLALYLGRAVTIPTFNRDDFRTAILKIAALSVAILERDDYSRTHYDISALMAQGEKYESVRSALAETSTARENRLEAENTVLRSKLAIETKRADVNFEYYERLMLAKWHKVVQRLASEGLDAELSE